jgi:hypothetical protein
MRIASRATPFSEAWAPDTNAAKTGGADTVSWSPWRIEHVLATPRAASCQPRQWKESASLAMRKTTHQNGTVNLSFLRLPPARFQRKRATAPQVGGIATTIRAISELSRQTPSVRMTKSAGSKTWPLANFNTDRSIFGRSAS